MQPDEPTSSPDTASPTTRLEVDLCVIGAGSGGLSIAAGAAAFGRRVVLIEKHKMGGDCLNYGCVPSKALIAAARRAHAMRTAASFGIKPVEPMIDHVAVNQHVQSVIAAIAPNDSVERFQGLGVQVIQTAGRFIDEKAVAAGDYVIAARRFVIATGSSPEVPPIPGLDDVDYFTNETLFQNAVRPEHLIIIGGGPIGIEMAQAHRRLGSRVTVIEREKALSKDDPEMASQLLDMIRAEGVDVREGTGAQSVKRTAEGVRVEVRGPSGTNVVDGSHLLLAVGRRPNIADLNLTAAGVRFEKSGIIVDRGTPDQQPEDLCHRGCGGRSTIHARRKLPCRYRTAACVVSYSGESSGGTRSLGDVHGTGTCSRRPERGRRNGKKVKGACAALAVS